MNLYKRFDQKGNTTIIVVVVILVAVVGGGFLLVQNNSVSTPQTAKPTPTEVAKDTTLDKDLPAYESAEGSDLNNEAGAGSYVDYSEDAFADAANNKRVYFFHASWCPTCRAAEQDFLSNTDQIPSGLVVFMTDYDSEKELKDKFNITSQHTFVQVDENGELITKWVGGGVEQLANAVK